MLICRKKLSTTYLVVLIMWFVPKSILLPKDLRLFRASPYAPEWSGNIHESKLSDIHRPTLSRLPIGRLKNHKYKKSAYGGKKSPARAGKKEISHRCYALHDNQEYTGGFFCTGESRTF